MRAQGIGQRSFKIRPGSALPQIKLNRLLAQIAYAKISDKNTPDERHDPEKKVGITQAGEQQQSQANDGQICEKGCNRNT